MGPWDDMWDSNHEVPLENKDIAFDLECKEWRER